MAKICGYADDNGIYDAFTPGTTKEASVLLRLEECLLSVQKWMNSNRLKMNPTKTEFIYFGYHKQLNKCKVDNVTVGDAIVCRTHMIKYLGMWLDEHLSFGFHISQKIKTAMYNIRNIRSIRKYLTIATCTTLVLNLVISHLFRLCKLTFLWSTRLSNLPFAAYSKRGCKVGTWLRKI